MQCADVTERLLDDELGTDPELDRHVVIASDVDSNAARGLLNKLKSAGVNVVYLEAPPPAKENEGDKPKPAGDDAI